MSKTLRELFQENFPEGCIGHPLDFRSIAQQMGDDSKEPNWVEFVELLSEYTKNLQTIYSFDFSNNRCGDDVSSQIFEIIANKTQNINAANNGITDRGAATIADLILTANRNVPKTNSIYNYPFEWDLRDNKIENCGAEKLLKAIAERHQEEEVYSCSFCSLSGNSLTDDIYLKHCKKITSYDIGRGHRCCMRV